MVLSHRGLWGAILAAGLLFSGWLIPAGQVGAKDNAPPFTVQDEAGFFEKNAKEKANRIIASIKEKYGKDLLIETREEAPAGYEAAAKQGKQAGDRFIADWARERARNARVNGIYVLICKEPSRIQVVIGQHTLESGAFTAANRNQLVEILQEKLRAKKPNEALLEGVEYVAKTLDQNLGKGTAAGALADQHEGAGGAADGHARPNWMGWVCFGIVALLVVWLIFGLVRGFSSAGAGSGGPGGGYGYGGGGFLTGLLGGLFGAMAGSWLYHNVFGGGGWGSSSAYAGDPGATDTGTDVGGDYSSSGADYDDSGGGDYGGNAEYDDGGGDFGGGDFGGGDFGGGSGDFGGGGDF